MSLLDFESIISDGLLQREDYTQETVDKMDRLISRFSAIARYRIARKYCFGSVVDAACGCGYGSYIVSLNPDVTSVLGLDLHEEIVASARERFGKAEFDRGRGCSRRFMTANLGDVSNLIGCTIQDCFFPDVFLSVETIEHLESPRDFIDGVKALGVARLILTFPSYKTTHFNHWHKHDLSAEQISEYVGASPVHAVRILDEVDLLVFDFKEHDGYRREEWK